MAGPYDNIIKKLHEATDRALNALANNINKKIQDNTSAGKDVNDRPFAPLSTETTIPDRERKGFQSGPPLDRSGKLKSTKIDRGDLKYTIKMAGRKKGLAYGALHNEGYTTSAKSAYPNKRVPARKWFGIPKGFTGDGKEAKLFKKQLANIIGSAFRGTTRRRIK